MMRRSHHHGHPLMVALFTLCFLLNAVESFQLPSAARNLKLRPYTGSSSYFDDGDVSFHTRISSPCLNKMSESKLCSMASDDDDDDDDDKDEVMDSDDDESLSEEERMKLVRQLQKAFYSSSAPVTSTKTTSSTSSDGDDDDEAKITTNGAKAATEQDTATRLDPATGILHNLPLWRVGWTEVPGRANCLNVHEGHYTNMFETIIQRSEQDDEPMYFGHLHLPGGTKNARSGKHQFELKTWQEEVQDEGRWDAAERSAVVGCLMRITDFRRLQDGRLVILVHPLERFVVTKVHQSFPYGLADVQILPDADDLLLDEAKSGGDENFHRVARASKVRQAFECYHKYECAPDLELPLPTDSEYLETTAAFGSAISKLLPFAFFDDDDSILPELPSTVKETTSDLARESFAGGNRPLEQTLINGGILQFPPSLVTAADITEETQSDEVLETLLWIELDDFCRSQKFRLPDEILQLMPLNLADTLDMEVDAKTLSPKYPAPRRRQRLSFQLPAILEGSPAFESTNTMRTLLLSTPTTSARLRNLLERFQAINEALMGRFE